MEKNKHVRISLVEDNPVNRRTFQQQVQLQAGWQLVFVARDGRECLTEMKSLPADCLPQVIFMDIEMPQLNGIDTIAIAKSLYPTVHFIILTVYDDDDKIFEAIRAGASGYLLKHESHLALHEAVNNVLNLGGAPMSPAIARKTLQLLNKPDKPLDKNVGKLPALITVREKEILEHTISGRDAKQIAALLFLSTHTVRKHIANIYQKLQVQSKAEVIHMAHRNNWYKF